MEIKLIRKYYQAKYTIGRLYVNNRFFFRLPRTALTTSYRTKRVGDNPNCKIQGIQSYPHRALSHPHHTQPTVRTMAAAADECEGV